MTVKGRVQGVGYRYFVRQTAQSLSLTGWVRNCPDGDVEAQAQGGEQDLAVKLGQLGLVGRAEARSERDRWPPAPEAVRSGFDSVS